MFVLSVVTILMMQEDLGTSAISAKSVSKKLVTKDQLGLGWISTKQINA